MLRRAPLCFLSSNSSASCGQAILTLNTYPVFQVPYRQGVTERGLERAEASKQIGLFVWANALGDLTQNLPRLITCLFGGEHTVRANRHANSAIVEFALRNVDLAIDSDAQTESLQIGVPIEGLPGIRVGQSVHDALVQSVAHEANPHSMTNAIICSRMVAKIPQIVDSNIREFITKTFSRNLAKPHHKRIYQRSSNSVK